MSTAPHKGRTKPDWRPEPGYPDYLYHYTSTQRFHDIITSGALHATHLWFLDDTREFEPARETLLQVVRERLAKRSGKRRDLLLQLQRSLEEPALSTFSASFSELDDDLSQWRSYARGRGVAIGFPRRDLQTFGVDHGYLLQACEYRAEAHRDWMESLLDDAVADPGRWNPTARMEG